MIAIGLGGFVGAISRSAVDGLVMNRAAGSFPWGTLTVNVTGSFALGFLFALLAERVVVHAHLKSAMTVGFLGAYTTFSTFALDTMRLAEAGDRWHAAGNVLLSVSAALIAVIAGTWAGRSI